MNRRRLVNSALLLVGLAAIAYATTRTVSDAKEQVLPSAQYLAVAAVLAFASILSSARAWVALFRDLVTSRASGAALRGTFYLSQLTKYLPVGGVVQAASQMGLARTLGVPMRRVAVAFPVSVVGAVAAGGTIGSGLVFDTALSGWERALALLGLLTVAFLHRGLMARVLEIARRFIHRIPSSENLSTQRDILGFYAWGLVTIGSLCVAYALLLHSVAGGVNPFVVACAFAMSWLVGFLAVPIPAGVGIREAMLVALVPGVGAAPLLAASLALRLLSICAEVLTFFANKLVVRRSGAHTFAAAPAPEVGVS
jgi:hypothetical protein